jgi:hypothetical protein
MIAAPVYVTTITQWAIRPTGPRGNMSKWVSDLRGKLRAARGPHTEVLGNI